MVVIDSSIKIITPNFVPILDVGDLHSTFLGTLYYINIIIILLCAYQKANKWVKLMVCIGKCSEPVQGLASLDRISCAIDARRSTANKIIIIMIKYKLLFTVHISATDKGEPLGDVAFCAHKQQIIITTKNIKTGRVLKTK